MCQNLLFVFVTTSLVILAARSSNLPCAFQGFKQGSTVNQNSEGNSSVGTSNNLTNNTNQNPNRPPPTIGPGGGGSNGGSGGNSNGNTNGNNSNPFFNLTALENHLGIRHNSTLAKILGTIINGTLIEQIKSTILSPPYGNCSQDYYACATVAFGARNCCLGINCFPFTFACASNLK